MTNTIVRLADPVATFTEFRWWLANRIRPIPVNEVVRDRDEARRFMCEQHQGGYVSADQAQKAMDAFTRMQDDAQALDDWRRGDDDLIWDKVRQKIERF